MSQRKGGITLAGNILTDVVKTVDCYPNIGMLANISDVSRAVGGCVPNTGIDLKKIDKDLRVTAIGKIGNDEGGKFLLGEFDKYGVECDKVKVSDAKPTSFSDVMSMPSGERTFFHARGANAEFSPEDLDVETLDCDIFHIGYILLLDSMDKADEQYGTVMAGLLKAVQERGIKTSIDVVSDSTADYKAKIIPALKYSNYAIMNEIESGMITDLDSYNADGTLNVANIRKTMETMASLGVKDKIIVHCKEAGFCFDVKSGEFTASPSLNIPKEEIRGSVGAGDAFCAGALYGIYNGFSDKEILDFASSAAACNLFAENSIDGMKSAEEIKNMAAKYGRKEIKLC